MNNLNPFLFLVPTIALTLVVFIFIYFLRNTGNKKLYKQFVYKTFAFAFLLNFAWEIIQMPLYEAIINFQHIAFCSLASVADAIMVLLIYFGFALIYKSPLWISKLTIPRTLLLMLVGGVGAVASEVRHLSAGSWAYSKSMPNIPIFNVGLSPVLQFILLPVCIYYLSYKIKLPGRVNKA